MSTMMNDNDIALKFKVTIRILFVFGRMIVLIICIWPKSKDPLFGTALLYLEQGKLRLMLYCLQSSRVQSLMSFLTWLAVESSWKALSATEVDWTLRVSDLFHVCSRYTSFVFIQSVPEIILRCLTCINLALLLYANIGNFLAYMLHH